MKIDPFPGVLTAQLVDRPFTTKTGKAACQRVKALVLTDEQREWFCRWFPEEENSRLMAASGMSVASVACAVRWHLQKTTGAVKGASEHGKSLYSGTAKIPRYSPRQQEYETIYQRLRVGCA